jgi:hypothetical protein
MDLLIINFILAIPTFFLVRLTFKKINPTWNRLRNPFIWLTTFFLTLVIYVGLFLTWICIETYYPERDFDKEAWTENEEKKYENANNLVDNQKLIGLTKTEIKEKLGEPNYENENSMTYYLGFSPRHFFGIDPDWLEIMFDQDKAKEISIITS